MEKLDQENPTYNVLSFLPSQIKYMILPPECIAKTVCCLQDLQESRW